MTVNVAPTSDVTDAEHTTREWESRLAQALHRLPTLTSDIPGLEQYYRRSLASGLVCWWDHPDFVTQPFIATSGLDGGALCAYAWDTGGYAPNVLSLMLGDSVLDIIESLLDADLTDRYAIAPDGTGLGVAYAYSGWSLVALTRAAAAEHRLDPAVVARLYDVLIALDKRFQPDDQTGVLRDYGDQSNLLEMRGSGWEHVVASPNAERAWALETLAELSDLTGAALPADDLRASAQQIREEVIRQLWDDEAGWFRTRYPDGHTELTYSIQAYDVLRSGACPPEVAAALLKHLRPARSSASTASAVSAPRTNSITRPPTSTGPAPAPTPAKARNWPSRSGNAANPTSPGTCCVATSGWATTTRTSRKTTTPTNPAPPPPAAASTSSRASPAPRPSSPAWPGSARTPTDP